MKDAATLLALADRCEAATQADPMIELAIYQVMTGKEGIVRCMGREGMSRDVPAYTASLDAALALVPERWRTVTANQQPWEPSWVWRLGEIEGKFGKAGQDGTAATPALALTAAALRAHAAIAGEG